MSIKFLVPEREVYREHVRLERLQDRHDDPHRRRLWQHDWDGTNVPGALWAQWFTWAGDVRRSRGKLAMHELRLQLARGWRLRAGGLP